MIKENCGQTYLLYLLFCYYCWLVLSVALTGHWKLYLNIYLFLPWHWFILTMWHHRNNNWNPCNLHKTIYNHLRHLLVFFCITVHTSSTEKTGHTLFNKSTNPIHNCLHFLFSKINLGHYLNDLVNRSTQDDTGKSS